MWRAAIGLVWAALAGACGEGSSPASEAGEAPASGSRAAGAEGHGAALETVVGLDGSPLDPLAADAPATVLVFVSTHCPISNRYAPTVRAA
jgi:hypothetical protein